MGSCVMSALITETILNEQGNNEIKQIEQISNVGNLVKGNDERIREVLQSKINIIDVGNKANNMSFSFRGGGECCDDTDEKTISMLNSDDDEVVASVVISSSEGQSLVEMQENSLNISQSKSPKTLRSLMYSKIPVESITIQRSSSSNNHSHLTLKGKESFKWNDQYKFIFESDKPKYISQRSKIINTSYDINLHAHENE